MSYFKYNLAVLWFQIYREVLAQNKYFGDKSLKKGQLREITTSIFIATTNRGMVWPYSDTKVQVILLEMIKDICKMSKKQELVDIIKVILVKKNIKVNGGILAELRGGGIVSVTS